jgi:hypothetical protein
MRQLCQHGPGDHDTVSTFRELHRWRNSHSTGSARCERCEDVAGDHRDSKHLEASRSISKLSYSNVLDSRWVSPEDGTRGSPRGNLATAFRGGAVHSAWWFHREVLASGGQEFGQRCRLFLDVPRTGWLRLSLGYWIYWITGVQDGPSPCWELHRELGVAKRCKALQAESAKVYLPNRRRTHVSFSGCSWEWLWLGLTSWHVLTCPDVPHLNYVDVKLMLITRSMMVLLL